MDFDAEKPAGSGNFQTVRYSGRPTDGNESRTEAETAVYDFLDRTGVEYVTLCHPAAFTMEECEAVRRDIGAPVFKNLFLTNRQQTDFYLLMIPADKPFKTKYLSSQGETVVRVGREDGGASAHPARSRVAHGADT